MWDTTISLQPKIFLYSFVLGIMISIYFDLFKAIRVLHKFSNLQVFFQDIAFFLVVTPSVFIFLIAFTYGVLRGYVLIGLVLGFVIWRITLSRYFILIMAYFFGLLKKIFANLSAKVSQFTDDIILFISKIVKKFFKMVKKALFSLKKA